MESLSLFPQPEKSKRKVDLSCFSFMIEDKELLDGLHCFPPNVQKVGFPYSTLCTPGCSPPWLAPHFGEFWLLFCFCFLKIPWIPAIWRIFPSACAVGESPRRCALPCAGIVELATAELPFFLLSDV
jgi:hypothetical protein